MFGNPLREKLRTDQVTFGMWVTLESPNVTEAAVALGMDWVVIEMEHGHLNWGDVVNHVRVVRGTETAAIIRVADTTRENVQRSLDLGAHGIILPMANSGDDVERAFELGRYPPRGVRGVGGERCVTWGLGTSSYLGVANDETLIIPLLETRGAIENIDQILNVDGLEVVFFGPADMSASYGHLGEWEGGDVARTILTVREKAASRGIASGILARSVREAEDRCEQGFRMIALGSDVGLMIQSIQQALDVVRHSASRQSGGQNG